MTLLIFQHFNFSSLLIFQHSIFISYITDPLQQWFLTWGSWPYGVICILYRGCKSFF